MGNEYVFDVIIMDIFDPFEIEEKSGFDSLHEEEIRYQLDDALSKDGIIITQLGQSPESSDSPQKHSRINTFLLLLIEEDFMQSVFQYENFYQRYSKPWSFLVMCKTKG